MPARLRAVFARTAVACLVVTGVTPATAQQPVATAPKPDTSRTGVMVPAAFGMGVAGLFGGWIAGGAVEHFGRQILGKPCPKGRFCETGEAVGIITGFTIGVPLGAHLANHKRGSFRKALLASAAAAVVGGAGYALFRPDSGDRGQNLFLWPTVAAQVAASVIVENATTPHPLPAPPVKAAPPPAH